MLPFLVLASTSVYRRELLARLGLKFRAEKPLFDEEAEKNLPLKPSELACHLALKKAESLLTDNHCIIGGDQIVVLEEQILGKPKTMENAIKQLQLLSGRSHELLTAMAIVSTASTQVFLDRTRLRMRALSDQEIKNYLKKDQAFDCAGSYKIEQSGIALFEQIECQDFTAIQGLPLIQLTAHLKKMGFEIPGDL